VCEVFPTDQWDKVLFQGFTGEVWMQPDVTLANLTEHMASWYRQESPKGKVALVLGAGNVSSIGPMDALYKLFVEGQVVVLKMNPVNEYLGPIFEECFLDLQERGYFRVVYGGAAEGDYLTQHPMVDEIHITGSDKTHDAIVFGVGEDGARRKRERQPRNTKRVTSELGNVSPIIVVPGRWSQSDLNFQGVNLVSSLTNNAGFNCNATRVVVTHRGWAQREPLLKAVGRAFEQARPREAYYPGAEERMERLTAEHPEAERYGEGGAGRLPWTLIPDLDPEAEGEPLFEIESFNSLFGETAIEGGDAAEFLDRAAEFCNARLWGTLNVTLIVHSASLRDAAVRRAFERAVADLRYGTVAINHWAAVGYVLVVTPWGAYPGHTPQDVQSGIGVVHNTLMFSKVEKTVVRSPFRAFPKPPWFPTHGNDYALAEALTAFEASPSPLRLPGVFAKALRG
jgi:hypothetical protein